jgi:hypothetical protein
MKQVVERCRGDRERHEGGKGREMKRGGQRERKS